MNAAFPRKGWVYLDAGLALAVVLLVFVLLATPNVQPLWGFSGVMAAYRLAFCLPVFLVFVTRERRTSLFSLRLAPGAWWVPAAIGVQVAVVGVGALGPVIRTLSQPAVALAGALAVVNGPLEEAAWRGTALEIFEERPISGLCASLVLFTL